MIIWKCEEPLNFISLGYFHEWTICVSMVISIPSSIPYYEFYTRHMFLWASDIFCPPAAYLFMNSSRIPSYFRFDTNIHAVFR